MKFFIIAALALAAVASANEENFKKRVEDFKVNKSELREKWISMTEEERQKVRGDIIAKLPHRPLHQFQEIPVEIRQKMKEKFESLSPEKRQKIHDHFQRRFSDGARAYSAGAEEKVVRNRFESLSEEKKQMIREKFAKLTPEQREEIRKLHLDQQIPAIVGPVAAGDFQPIRSREDDIMISDQFPLDFKPNRKNPRFPEGDYQQVRTLEDRTWVNELQAEKKKQRV